jgi:CHAT domain-containing protein/Tfp pilus assembly protein PilF
LVPVRYNSVLYVRSLLFLAVLACAAAAPQTTAESAAGAVQRLLDSAHSSEAEAAARSWVATLETQHATDSLEYAKALDLLADTLTSASSPLSEVQNIIDRSIALKIKLRGENDISIAESLNILGLRQFRGGAYSDAIADFTRAWKLEEQPELVVDAALKATTLNGLGLSIGAKGDPQKAVEIHQEALEIREKLFGKEDWRTAEVLFSLATDYRGMGDLARSFDFIRRSVDIFERTNPEHPAAAMAIGALATVYRERAEHLKAKPLFEKSIEIFTRNFGPDSPRLVASYNNYGLCLKSLSDFHNAGLAMEKAVRISRKANGSNSSITAQALGNLGILYQQDGDYSRARTAYESALSILEDTLGPDHQATAAVLTSLGLVLRDMGDLQTALPYIERARAIYQKHFGPENPKTLQLDGNLASIYTKQKNYKAARPLVETTLAADRKTLGENNVTTAGELAALGRILAETGEITKSEDLYRRAIAIYDAVLTPVSYSAAQARAELADVELRAGKFGDSIDLARQSVESLSQLFGSDYNSLGPVLATQAEAELNQGKMSIAFDHALESARVRRRNLLAVSRSTSERQALLYSENGGNGLDIALRIASAGLVPESRAKLWDAVIRDRALVLDEMAERQRSTREAADPQLTAASRTLKEAREELAKAVVSGPRGKEKDYVSRVQRLRANLESDERQLAFLSTDYRLRLNRERAGLREVAATLSPSSALAAYVRFSDGYLAFVFRSGEKFPSIIPLASAHQIETLFQQWRAQIDRERDFQGHEAVKNELSYREAGSALRRAVWDPVAKLLPGITNLYITADGVLQLVNLNALPVGQHSYLMETAPLLHVLSAERDILKASMAGDAGRQMLAFGRPAFDSKPAPPATERAFRGIHSNCQTYSSLEFVDLPSSAREANSVLKMWQAQGKIGISLIGDRATETAFKEMAAGKSVIHLATHGFFLGKGCAASEDPLLRSGLALAGANRRSMAGPQQDDGILTAAEVASLDLSSAELVVLSGCDTGDGEIRAGEGVLGLRRAFQIAGARNLVMSLWPVTDDGALAWMTALYKSSFSRNHQISAAVRDASLAQLRARRFAHESTHPFYWAGFISLGN